MKLRFSFFWILYFKVAITTNFAQRPPNMDLLFSRLKHYDSLAVKTYADDSIATGVLGRVCWEYRLINIDSATFYCNEAMQMARNANYIKGIGLIYNQTAAVYRQRGDFVKALDCHNKALEIWRSFRQSNPAYYYSSIILDEARTLNNMGIIYDQLGEKTKALDLYLKAMAIDEQKGNQNGVANKLGNIGNLFLGQNQYDKALSYYFRVLKIDEKISDKNRMAECYGDMGFAYWKKGNKDSAMQYYQKAVKMNESVGNKQLLSENFGNMSLIFEEEKDYKNALDYANKSLNLKKDIDDKPGTAAVLGNIGSMYMDRNMLVDAEKYLLQAEAIADSLRQKPLQLDQYINLCSLYAKKEMFHEAFVYQQKMISLKDSLSNQAKIEEITRKEMNYEFNKKQDSTKAAYEKQIAIEEANKKVAIAEAEKKRIKAEGEKLLGIAQAETKRITAEADRENAISESNKRIAIAEAEKKQNKAEADKKLALTNAALEKQMLIRNSIAAGAGILVVSSVISFLFYKRKRDADQKQKETFLNLQASENEMKALRSQMNPHFIFNALQSIQTFLLSNRPEQTNTYLLKFSNLMRLILENSRNAEVPLQKDLEALELYMQLECLRLQYPFTYRLDIDEEIDTESATMPPLILQPFIENAIWHGLQYKPESGHIDIKISKQDEYMIFKIKDNGVGRLFAKQMNTHHSENNKSLGLKITAERLAVINEVKRTNALFEITDLFNDTNKPSGTLITLKLPYNGND